MEQKSENDTMQISFFGDTEIKSSEDKDTSIEKTISCSESDSDDNNSGIHYHHHSSHHHSSHHHSSHHHGNRHHKNKKDNKFIMEYCSDIRIYQTTYELMNI